MPLPRRTHRFQSALAGVDAGAATATTAPSREHTHGTPLRLLALLLILSALAPVATPATDARAASATANVDVETVYFPVTGHHVTQPFIGTWHAIGGLATFGYPLSEQFTDPATGLQVQLFERARFEQHPEFAGTDAEVQFTLLGRWLAEQGASSDPAFTPYPHPADTPPLDTPERRFFPETGHYLAYGFKSYWEQHGGLRIFGFPISEEFSEGGVTVQYFERARMEYHPEHAGTPYAILLDRLGADRAVADGVDTTPVARADGVPDYDPALFTPQPTSFTLPVLMYHQIGDAASRYVIPLWRLEQQLDWLQANGYTTITMAQAYDALEGRGRLPERPVLLTFDDGFTSQWAAVQALNARGMTGTFFITTGQLHLADWQLREMVAAGHEIGAHTRSHPDLTTLSDVQLVEEISGVRQELQAASGSSVDFFAYPRGAYDWRVIDVVQQAGYRGAVAAWGGSWWEPGRWWSQPRIEVDGTLGIDISRTLLP